ncbi:uncharacterized protein LOC123922717 [Trifolium pratense]|uniref:uncharacterized protein LOC123922717 n=1 Tax=Trifolium pratense TaxID=57577 RepID=UPI001E69678F|nr:uncharacterized protein LOC123922717 [Trifolium pratense]
MTNVSIITYAAFVLALIFKSNNAMLMPFLIDANANYCKSIMNYMEAECQRYFLDDKYSQPDYSCCSAFQVVAAHATSCSCICDTIEDDNNLSMEARKIQKLPTICGLSSPPCPSPGPSHAPNSSDDNSILVYLFIVLSMLIIGCAVYADCSKNGI